MIQTAVNAKKKMKRGDGITMEVGVRDGLSEE